MGSIPVSRHSAILPKNQIEPLLPGTLCSVLQSFLSFPSTKHFTMRRAFVGSEDVWLWVQSMTWRHLVNILWSSFCNAFCDVSLRSCKDSKLKKKVENWSQTSCVASGNVWVQTLTVGASPLQVSEYKHDFRIWKRGDAIAHITLCNMYQVWPQFCVVHVCLLMNRSNFNCLWLVMIYSLTSVTCLDMRLLFSVVVDSLIWKMKTNAKISRQHGD